LWILSIGIDNNPWDQYQPLIPGDYNAIFGKIPIAGILGTNGEITVNNNGHKLKEFASVNELKITNTFFRHKEIHKMTWNAREYRSTID
jgi:hypothetical protein